MACALLPPYPKLFTETRCGPGYSHGSADNCICGGLNDKYLNEGVRNSYLQFPVFASDTRIDHSKVAVGKKGPILKHQDGFNNARNSTRTL